MAEETTKPANPTTAPTNGAAPAAAPGGAPGRGGAGQMQQRRGGRRNKSRYGTQMEEKKNLKDIFGLREGPLKRYYNNARNSKNETGPYMISLMERRLDNAVYRTGLGGTRKQARQMVSHRLFEVNGKAVDVPSFELKKGDVVNVRENKRDKHFFANFEKRMQNAQLPEWIEVDVKGFGFKVVSDPTLDEARLGIDVQAVVELLSR